MNTTTSNDRCKATIHRAGSFRGRPCVNKAGADGFCGVHSEVTAEKKRAKRNEEAAFERRNRETLAATAKQLIDRLSEETGVELKWSGVTYGRDGIRSSVTIPFDELRAILASLESRR